MMRTKQAATLREGHPREAPSMEIYLVGKRCWIPPARGPRANSSHPDLPKALKTAQVAEHPRLAPAIVNRKEQNRKWTLLPQEGATVRQEREWTKLKRCIYIYIYIYIQ
jgi:hypothetical protein